MRRRRRSKAKIIIEKTLLRDTKGCKIFSKNEKGKLISFQRYLYEKILYEEKKIMQAPVKFRIRSNIALMTFYRKKKERRKCVHKECHVRVVAREFVKFSVLDDKRKVGSRQATFAPVSRILNYGGEERAGGKK